jgi:hypothetical protein
LLLDQLLRKCKAVFPPSPIPLPSTGLAGQ